MSLWRFQFAKSSRGVCCVNGKYSRLLGCGQSVRAANGSTSLLDKVWSQCVPLPKCNSLLLQTMRTAFNIKKLSTEILDKFGTRYTQLSMGQFYGSQNCVVFPLYQSDKETLFDIKFCTVNGRQFYGNFENRVTTTASSLFGWHVTPLDRKKLVVTDSEFDALAVHQVSSLPAVSLPAGASRLSDDLIRYVDQFDCVVLWSGKDGPNSQISLQLAMQLSAGKCHIVRPPKDSPVVRYSPLEAMNNEMDVKQLIEEACPLHNEKIVSFRQLRDSLHDELLNRDQVTGLSWRRFPLLTKILKGHRRGELTVFTGPTGSGKTTFMSELSLDLCIQGVPTLWGSFEIRNVRLARTMINQLAGFNVEDQMEEYGHWAQHLESLPLYFMNFHGSQNLKSVIKTMSHAVYAYNIKHVVIDNLQFMISSELIKHDRFLYQDMVISEFRRFATSSNVHVTIVIHPRKEEDDRELSMSSIFGSAKASQEADNVLILQVIKGRGVSKRIQVTKNRFDGSLGTFPLHFDADSLRMSGFGSETTRLDDQGNKRRHVNKVVDRRTAPYAAAGQSVPTVSSGAPGVSMTTLSKKTRNRSRGSSRVQLDTDTRNKSES